MRFMLSVALFLLVVVPVSAQSQEPTFADLAERLLPSVVNISTMQKTAPDAAGADEMLEGMPEFPPGSPFEDFFKNYMEKHKKLLVPKNQRVNSLGSGFIIDPAGYIVTNYHVIQEADEIKVTLHDDTSLTAKVIGKDRKTDLALLKVDAGKSLPAITWGDSDKLRVGDWILVIGNPFGLGGSVTKGIISARARDINSGPYDDYLQTDASINRGNSGGPMFNLQGQVIGVNSAIYSPTGGSVGIGFSIPSALAENVIKQLKEKGSIKRGWLGVRIQTMTEDLAKGLGLPSSSGALVSSVTEGSPAAKAGLKQGDVILSFNGKDVSEMRKLPRLVADTPVGIEAEIKIWRQGSEKTLKTKVAELPQTEEEELAGKADEETPKQADVAAVEVKGLGIKVAPVAPSLIERFGLKNDQQGLVVVEALENSLAVEKGLSEGDVITEANQEKLGSAADLQKSVNRGRDQRKPLLLLVEREGELRFVAIPLTP